ncbi:hypothetical protein ACODUM_09190 [Stenotrophomonas maltophilia]
MTLPHKPEVNQSIDLIDGRAMDDAPSPRLWTESVMAIAGSDNLRGNRKDHGSEGPWS